jgi:deoxyribonuclease V
MNRTSPIAFLDAAYASDAAAVACLLADAWTAATPAAEISKYFSEVPMTYVSGEFYKREMPLLQQMIRGLTSSPRILVIDGYVWLGSTGELGLGAHLFAALGSTLPVVGVAKTRYRDDTWSKRIYRGASCRPLYVTAAGIDTAKAAELISSMHGDHRIPTLLQWVDRLARTTLANAAPFEI